MQVHLFISKYIHKREQSGIMENAVNKINTNDKIELVQNSSENIKNLIYTIRGKQVILDSDVAMLY